MLSDEALKLIDYEESLVSEVLGALKKRQNELRNKLGYEVQRAKELTQATVNFRDSVDKELNASSEALSHARKASFESELENLEKLINRPYFGRLVLAEQDRKISFKLGYASFSDVSIIDWRNAPIAKIYYEYDLGDLYEEEVAGTLREGEVVEKCVVEIKDGELLGITTGDFNLSKQNGTWQERKAGSKLGGYGEVSDVRGLLTEEQWSLINSDASGPLVVSGVAGTGKTTAALYRLSKNSNGKTLLLAGSDSMMAVLDRSREEVQLEDSEVFSFDSWVEELVKNKLPKLSLSNGVLMPRESFVFRSKELLEAVLQADSLQSALQKCKQKFSNLLGEDVIKSSLARTEESEVSTEEAVLMLVKSASPIYDQVLVDEVQDRSVPEVLLGMLSCKSPSGVVLVGDEAQDTQTGGASIAAKLAEVFKIYSRIKGLTSQAEAEPVVLNITHRGTKQIMKFAERIVGRKVPECTKEGKRPLWTHCLSMNMAIERMLEWLGVAVERYPTEPVAVLVGNNSEASSIYSMLTPRFGHLVNRAYQEQVSGIIVGTPEEVKGWEFPCVLIWNPNEKSFSRKSQGKQRLYVAATRARENLALITYGRYSSCLPNPHPSLVRFRDWKEVEETAQGNS